MPKTASKGAQQSMGEQHHQGPTPSRRVHLSAEEARALARIFQAALHLPSGDDEEQPPQSAHAGRGDVRPTAITPLLPAPPSSYLPPTLLEGTASAALPGAEVPQPRQAPRNDSDATAAGEPVDSVPLANDDKTPGPSEPQAEAPTAPPLPPAAHDAEPLEASAAHATERARSSEHSRLSASGGRPRKRRTRARLALITVAVVGAALSALLLAGARERNRPPVRDAAEKVAQQKAPALEANEAAGSDGQMHAGEPLVAPIVDPPHTQATPVAADPPSPQPASEKRRPPGRALDQETARPDEPGGSIVRETPF